jgi:hypothetical protein
MLAQLSAYLIFGEIANPVCSSEFFYENYTAGATFLLAARQLPNFLPTEAMVILTFFLLSHVASYHSSAPKKFAPAGLHL